MKGRLLSLLFLLAPLIVRSQENLADSLRQVLSKNTISSTERFNSLIALGVSISKSAPHEASEMFFKALALAEENKDSLQFAKASLQIGFILLDNAQYQQATSFLVRAGRLFEQAADTMGIIQSKNGLGQLFVLIRNPKKGVEYYKEALQLALASGKMNMIMPSYMNLGAAYHTSGDAEKALENYEKCRQLLDQNLLSKQSTEMGLSILYNNISESLVEQKNYTEAIHYQRRSLQMVERTGSKIHKSSSFRNLASLYLELNHLDSAVYWATRAIEIAKENNFRDHLMEGIKVLARAQVAKGNHQEALQYFARYVEIKDSLFDKRELGMIQQLYEGYQLGKKEEEIHSLKAQQEKLALDLELNRLYTWLAVVVALSLTVILGIITYNYFRKRRLARKLNQQNQEILRLNRALEIRALRSQMDPHFIFNVLNGLQHFITSHKAEESLHYLSKVARLIRLTLQNASRDWVTLHEEIEILKLYLEVEQHRFPGKFDFTFEIDETLEKEKIPFLVIQPYVENAVLHGLLPLKERKGKMKVLVTREDNTMVIQIEDNGVGRDHSANKTSNQYKSMASGLIRERLEKLSEQLEMVMGTSIEDLRDDNGNPVGTRSILIFELQPKLQVVAA